MASPSGRMLRRLLRLRQLEEEVAQQAVAIAAAERSRIASAVTAAEAWQRSGRRTVQESIAGGDTTGRAAALVEVIEAERRQLQMQPRLSAAERGLAACREAYLEERMGRRQVEMLAAREEAAARQAAARQAQQALDEWFIRRGNRSEPAAAHGRPEPP